LSVVDKKTHEKFSIFFDCYCERIRECIDDDKNYKNIKFDELYEIAEKDVNSKRFKLSLNNLLDTYDSRCNDNYWSGFWSTIFTIGKNDGKDIEIGLIDTMDTMDRDTFNSFLELSDKIIALSKDKKISDLINDMWFIDDLHYLMLRYRKKSLYEKRKSKN